VELTAYERVVFDTTTCIYFLESAPSDRRRLVIEPLVKAAESEETELSVSALTVTELLIGPLRAGNRVAEARARLFLYEICHVVPVEIEIAEAAARIRARHGLRTPDALVCATGLVAGAVAIVGNDARWKRLTEVNYVHLDDVAGSGLPN